MCILALVTITFWMIMSVWDPLVLAMITMFETVCLTVLLNPMMQIRDTLENVLDRSLVLTPSTCHLDLDRSELKLLSFRHAQNLEAVRRLPIIRNASGAGKGSN
jgi:hypothetical protein